MPTDHFSITPPTLPVDQESEILCGLGELNSYEAQDVLRSYEQNPPATIPLSGYEHDFTFDIDPPQTPSPGGQIHKNNCSVSIGNWPLRLLHVPTMTSLEWEPGNKYGAHIEPDYNAISYTWGRYDLDIPQAKKLKRYRNVNAVEINSVEWRIPRINPTHFTVDQFQRLIWQTCEPINGTEEKTDFLWLDIACIDQNNGPQKSAEIGRQAVIFHGAQRVFVWLTKIHEERLSQIVTDLLQSTNAAVAYAEEKPQHGYRAEALMDWLATARTGLDGIFMDPWFTSLWTLQEAFLCQHAYIMPLEGNLTPISTGSGFKIGSYATLETLCTLSTLMSEVIEVERPIVQVQWQADKTNPDVCKRLSYLEEVYGMLKQRGILALATRNPIALYNIAQYRRTTRDQDRVYGIQQIFGFRLGTSAPGLSESGPNYFNRFVLEDQLGAAILVKYPVASQLHNFTEPVEEGRGWRVSGSSTIPSLDIQCSIWSLEFERHCELSTEKISGQRWGCFRGQTCDFVPLSRAWKSAHEATSTFNVLGSKSPQQIMLDVFLRDITDGSPEEPIWAAVWSKRRDTPRDQQQHRLAQTLTELVHRHFGGEPLLVLLLGSFTDVIQSEQAMNEAVRYHVGLIIVHIQTSARSYWKRLGFCIWQYEYSDDVLEGITSSQLGLMRADPHCASWRRESGLFG